MPAARAAAGPAAACASVRHIGGLTAAKDTMEVFRMTLERM
jgi:hypothetical protein